VLTWQATTKRAKTLLRPDWDFSVRAVRDSGTLACCWCANADCADLWTGALQKMGIGGLDKEFEQIFRRAFTTRLFPPAIIKQFGQQHVKGAYSNRTGCHMAIAFDQTHLASSRFF